MNKGLLTAITSMKHSTELLISTTIVIAAIAASYITKPDQTQPDQSQTIAEPAAQEEPAAQIETISPPAKETDTSSKQANLLMQKSELEKQKHTCIDDRKQINEDLTALLSAIAGLTAEDMKDKNKVEGYRQKIKEAREKLDSCQKVIDDNNARLEALNKQIGTLQHSNPK